MQSTITLTDANDREQDTRVNRTHIETGKMGERERKRELQEREREREKENKKHAGYLKIKCENMEPMHTVRGFDGIILAG